jgi:anti-sigma factor RsiW
MADTTYGGLTCGEVRDLATPFVLGILEPAEAARVREHLATCPEPHPEIAELGSVVPALARSVETVQPAPDLGARILAAARAEQAERIASGAVAPPAPQPAAAPATTGRGTRADGEARGPRFGFLDALRTPRFALAGIAAVLVIAVLGAWNLQLQGQLNDLASYRDTVAAIETASAAAGTRPLLLAPGNGSAGPSGLAAFDASGRLLIAMRDLPPTSGSQVYEAWVIGADAKPVPAGSFVVGSGGTGTLAASVGDAQAFNVVALTREPGPGATTPTLPIIVQGTVHPGTS